MRQELRQKPHSPRFYTLHFTLTQTNIMKKVYIAPQTEAIELLGENAIMTGSTIIGWGGVGGYDGPGE